MTARESRISELLEIGQTLLDAVEPGIAIFNSDFELITWNRSFERMDVSEPGSLRLGLTLEENYRLIARRGVFGAGDPDELARERWEMVQAGASLHIEELRATDGRIIEIRRYFVAGIGVAAVFTDVTPTRQAEERARRAESLAQLGQFAGGLVHDFNNLLTVIIGSLEVDREEKSSAGEGAEVAIAAAKHGAALCRTALSLSVPQPLQIEPISVPECLDEVVRFLNRVVRGNVRVSLAVGHLEGRIRADRTRFCSAIVNLVLNARDSLPEGGEIRVAAQSLGSTIEISVEDNGVGMDASTLERIREPFYTTKKGQGGTGLGLSQVQDFLDSAGGEIEFWSQVGVGTRVKVRLPASEGVPAPESPTSAVPAGGSALIVDDDEDVRRVIVRMVRSLGFTCEEAGGVDEAMELIDSRTYDVLIVDFLLSGQRTGDELARAVRDTAPETAVILCSGYQDVVLEPMVPETQTILKPFTRARLASALEEALRKTREPD